MSKKRKCRYTQEELAIHEEAIKLRKMTDKQLVEAFREKDAETPTEAENKHETGKDTNAVENLLQWLSEGKCKGVKGATAYKIAMFASEMGLV